MTDRVPRTAMLAPLVSAARTVLELNSCALVDCTPMRMPPPEARATASANRLLPEGADRASTDSAPRLYVPDPPTRAETLVVVSTRAELAPIPAVVPTVMPWAAARLVPVRSARTATVPLVAVMLAPVTWALNVPPASISATPPPPAMAKKPTAMELTSISASRETSDTASMVASPANVIVPPETSASRKPSSEISARAPPPEAAKPIPVAAIEEASAVTLMLRVSSVRTMRSRVVTVLF